MRTWLVVVLVLLAAGVLSPTVAVADDASHQWSESPEIKELYPNPRADGDPGEFLTVRFSEPTDLSGWKFKDDGQQVAPLPERTVVGTVAFSHDPEKAASHTDHDVYQLSGWLQLADDGETVTLVSAEGHHVDSVSYERQAPEAHLYAETEGTWTWRPTDEPTFSFPAVRSPTVESIVLPDGAERIYELLETTDQRLAIGGYTMTDQRIVNKLIERHRSGVEVTVLLEASPVGGICDQQADALDRLMENGIDIRVRGGTDSRFRFHHAKYAVADDRALLMTENWKPAGVGGQSSRGWATIIQSPAFARQVQEIHTADRTSRDTTSWREYRTAIDPVEKQQAEGSYPTVHAPETHRIKQAQLLVGPDETASGLREIIRGADESIKIKQVQIGSQDFELLEETIDAARRGVDVEILLSSAWYAKDDNEILIEKLEKTIEQENLPVEIDIAQPTDQFGSIHAKGIIIDNKQVVIASVNWNEVSLHENRELAVILTSEEVAKYYAAVFAADRSGESWTVLYGLVVVVISGWIVTAAVLWWKLQWRG